MLCEDGGRLGEGQQHVAVPSAFAFSFDGHGTGKPTRYGNANNTSPIKESER